MKRHREEECQSHKHIKTSANFGTHFQHHPPTCPTTKHSSHLDQSHSQQWDPTHRKSVSHHQPSNKTPYSDKNVNKYHKPLPVQPVSLYNLSFPHFRKPSEIGYFSQDSQDGSRQFRDNASQLKLYHEPSNKNNVSFNLRTGYHTFIKRDETVKEYLNDLLKWILHHRDVFTIENQPSTSCLFTDFICWRGLLTKVLCTPYENREGWKIAVILFNKTYYICDFDTDELIQQRQNDTERQKEMTYWGYKFEQYVTIGTDGKRTMPNTDVPVNNMEAYGSVVRTRLNQHSLVYGGEIDCYEMEKEQRKYIELKTSREIEHPRQLSNFKRYKVLKWWAQSFLVGIEKLICGFRDDDGIVHRMEDFHITNLPKFCKDIPNCWEPNVCFNFLDKFLQHVKDIVQIDDPKVVHLFTWYPREKIQCTKCPPDSEYCFLPAWYIQDMQDMHDRKSSTSAEK